MNIIIRSISISLVLAIVGCAEIRKTTPLFKSTPIKINTSDIADIRNRIVTLQKRYTANQILVVFDLDDTLLTAPQFVGSDTWYQWQSGKIKTTKGRLIPGYQKVPCLLDMQGWMYSFSPMKYTDSRVKPLVEYIQGQKIASFVLTARGNEFRGATERVLKQNLLSFKATALGKKSDGKVPLALYVDKDGKRSATVSYLNGIMMVAGLHKGKMLANILRKYGQQKKVIVFVDDNLKNVNNVMSEFANRPERMFVFHYTKVSKPITKAVSIASYCRTVQLMKTYYRLSPALHSRHKKKQACSIQSNQTSFEFKKIPGVRCH